MRNCACMENCLAGPQNHQTGRASQAGFSALADAIQHKVAWACHDEGLLSGSDLVLGFLVQSWLLVARTADSVILD